jgi:DNA polymerase III delta prime subunit
MSWRRFLFYRDIWTPWETDKEERMEKITFQLDDGTIAEFYVEEQTMIGGTNYLLVSDSLDDEADAYIMKDVSEETSLEACYEMVEDEDEIQAVFKVFEQMLEDVDLEM